MTPIDLTIVVPLLNEEQNVQLLYDAITAAMLEDSLQCDYEILFVDDGSTDKTFELSARLADSDQRLKVIRFRKNFGQTPAMAAGIDFASGKKLSQWMAICKTIRRHWAARPSFGRRCGYRGRMALSPSR